MKMFKKLLVSLITFVFVFTTGVGLMTPEFVKAATLSGADRLIAAGMSDVLARYFVANLISVNNSGNLVAAVATTKKFSVTVAGVEELAVDGTTATIASNNILLTSGDLISAGASKGMIAGEATRAANVTTATTAAAPFYVSGAAASYDLTAYVGTGASTSGPAVDHFKTRATTGAATTIVQSGDSLGILKFFGANGTTYDPAAYILATVDGTPGAATDMPGALDFQLSPDGSVTPASVLKLKNDKTAVFGGSASIPGGIINPTANEEAVAGAGTTVSDAAALSATKHIHQITGANGTLGWKFPSLAVGQLEILLNTTAGVPKVYAVSGGTCNGGATDAACTLVTGIAPHLCWAAAANTLICS